MKSMTQDEALQWIAGIFAEKREKIRPETARDDVPSWDSIGVITLMAELDEKCGIVLEEKDLQSMKKIDDILAVMRKHGKLEG